MKTKLSHPIMLFVALALVLSMAATVAPTTEVASAQSGGLNSWVRHNLPTTQYWQMAPNTSIWDLTACDDGTLLALVEDTSGLDVIDGVDNDGDGPVDEWDGLRWAVYPAYSDVSLFKSTDGGYTWTLMWHMPSSETGAPIAVVPQPGYVDGDPANSVVFIAAGTRIITPGAAPVGAGGPGTGNLYRSFDGGSTFTRVTPRCPAVTLAPMGATITSLDVGENRNAPGTYMALVGVVSLDPGGGRGEGIYTWNEDDDRDWKDKQVVTSLPPAPFPGTLPAGNGMNGMNVLFSPNWFEDGCFMAVILDLGIYAGTLAGTYLCFFDDDDGTWGGDIDSPTNAPILPTGIAPDFAQAACLAVGDDFAKTSDTNVFVGITAWSLAPGTEDVYRILGLSTVTGPSTVTATGCGPLGAGALLINDIVVDGPADSGAVYVGCEFPAGQAQVFKGTQATLWPNWTPSFKPPSGRWPTFLAGGSLYAAGGGDGFTTSGVHVMVDGAGGRTVFNGRGLLDDIAVSEDIPGYANNNQVLVLGTSWCLAEAVAEEVSPMYETDGLIYVATYSEHSPTGWSTIPAPGHPVYPGSLSLWRWKPGSSWERIMYEELTLPIMIMGTNAQFAGKFMQNPNNRGASEDSWVWWPRVPRGFSDDPYVFLMGGIADSSDQNLQEMLWYSPDLGDTWIRFNQMPIGALDGVAMENGLVETGWWVETNSLLFVGDTAGWVYKTTNRGDSWTEGALTANNLIVTDIITSPIYSETGNSDKCVLVGTFEFNIPGPTFGDFEHEIWLSQDGCIQDLENVGAEICTQPIWTLNIYDIVMNMGTIGNTVVNFDINWEQNRNAYAAASGFLDRWQLVGPAAGTELSRIDYVDVGIYRTQINLDEPSASSWEQLWGPDEFDQAIDKKPQPVDGMLHGWDIFRGVRLSDLQVGNDGSLYVPLAVFDMSYNIEGVVPPPGFIPERAPSPNGAGRTTLGGVLRCLEPTAADTQWQVVDRGLGEWDGLQFNRAVPGSSNTLISLAYDRQEWRWKLAIYDDTLSTTGAVNEPSSGDAGVGTLADNKVSVTLKWGALDADVYEWQVDDDCGFVPPYAASGVTSEEHVTVTGLSPAVDYCWRVRAKQPYYSRWSQAQSFSTIIGPERMAPKLLSPKAGTTITETQPSFQWTAIGWATKYHIQVATDSGFGSADLVVDQQLGNQQAYQAPTDLARDTYYWRVMASSDTSQTEWSSTGAFIVAGQLPGEGTPGWVWILVVVGAILVIALLILVMRTRATV